ncbi:hypothetical protein PoMZ_06136 [Pyricularia oryzae]|uniref:Uncharacterized protein n=1 Tax=Pyricularia oryzae TaxID=318829 RepID=A0A4V1C7S8_PYROR|nr:hypothetical protein PoMZ_06136 [Pyricularia oryzae]
MLVIVEGRFIHRTKIFWGRALELYSAAYISGSQWRPHKIRSPYRFNGNINFVQVDAHGSS